MNAKRGRSGGRSEGNEVNRLFADLDLVLKMMAVNWSQEGESGKKARKRRRKE